MIFDASLFEKEICAVDHLLNKGSVKSVEYFRNLGMNSTDLLIITDNNNNNNVNLYSAITIQIYSTALV